MMFQKKSNESWTGLCKYFDENFYKEDRNDTECFRAMYLIYYMLACRQFPKGLPYSYYDEFAYYAASTIYMRFIKKQNNGEKIKSLLNYAKATLAFLKIMYQKESYRQVTNPNDEEELKDVQEYRDMLRDSIQENTLSDDGFYAFMIDTFKDAPRYIINRLNKTPYKKDKVMMKRLYMSCLLTFISDCTLSNKQLERIMAKKSKGQNISSDTISKMLSKTRDDGVILWRLDDSYKGYVELLITLTKKDMMDEIEETKAAMTIDYDTVDAILGSAWDELSHDRGDIDEDL